MLFSNVENQTPHTHPEPCNYFLLGFNADIHRPSYIFITFFLLFYFQLLQLLISTKLIDYQNNLYLGGKIAPKHDYL